VLHASIGVWGYDLVFICVDISPWLTNLRFIWKKVQAQGNIVVKFSVFGHRIYVIPGLREIGTVKTGRYDDFPAHISIVQVE
jgi:hypothetical protein